jgi:hypothetical protein
VPLSLVVQRIAAADIANLHWEEACPPSPLLLAPLRLLMLPVSGTATGIPLTGTVIPLTGMLAPLGSILLPGHLFPGQSRIIRHHLFVPIPGVHTPFSCL